MIPFGVIWCGSKIYETKRRVLYMDRIQWKGGALLAPAPAALVTCRSGGIDNVLTVAWTGILSTQPPTTYVSVRPQRHSYNIIKESGVFAINITTRELLRAADFCGVKSGRDMDKFEKAGLIKQEAFEIDCPVIAQSPITLECRVNEIKQLGSHDMFIAQIISVGVDPKLVDESGRLMLEKADLIAFAHGAYFGLSKSLGGFGFSVMKKKTRRRKK